MVSATATMVGAVPISIQYGFRFCYYGRRIHSLMLVTTSMHYNAINVWFDS